MNSDTISSAFSFPVEMVKNRLNTVLYTNFSQIDHILDFLLGSGGKLMRPKMVYLAASTYPGYDFHRVVDMAVAVELIHMDSLVHDDVIDRADTRRGRESLNYYFGNHTSVLTGDYLFAAAFNLVNSHDEKEVMDIITRTIQVMCSGEIKQMSLNGDIGIDEDAYYDKSYRKTACLFAASCRIGALAADAPDEHADKLEKYGLNLGYAYQIIDDVLDFTADPVELGKPAGNDLTQGNITLPIILALKDENSAPKLIKLLENGRISFEKMPAVLKILDKSGALDQSIDCSRSFLLQAIDEIEALEASTSRDALKDMACQLLESYHLKIRNSHHAGGRRVVIH